MFDLEARLTKSHAHWSASAVPTGGWKEKLHPFGQDVGSLVPPMFQNYGRLLHPFVALATGATMKWREVAAGVGKEVTASSQWEDFAPDSLLEAKHLAPPSKGSMPADLLSTLIEHLETFTQSEPCFFAIWTGYGWLHQGGAVAQLQVRESQKSGSGRRRPRQVGDAITLPEAIHLPHRAYRVYEGPLGAAASFADDLLSQSPNLWWPNSLSWFVSTEVDLCSTYLGGPRDLVQGLLGDPRVECIVVHPDAPI